MDDVEQGQGTSSEGVIFVALGKDAKEDDSVLMWALHNSRGMGVCILHVHQPPQTMPLLGSPVSIRLADEQEAKAYCELKSGKMHNILDKCIRTCVRAGVRAEKMWIDMDSIEKGIVQLISERRIKWLVMGAAADKHYSRRMKELRSQKAKYVRTEAPMFCHIWFICKGNLIHTRESESGSSSVGAGSPLFQAAPCGDPAWYLRSRSIAEGENSQIKSQSSIIHHRRVRSASPGMQYLVPVSPLGRNSSAGSHFSEGFDEILGHSNLKPLSPESNEIGSESPMIPPNLGDNCASSVAASTIEGNMNDEMYARLQKFMGEAESSQREAYEESVKRRQAEKEVIDIVQRAKEYKTMCAEELRRRKEIEEALERVKEEAVKKQCQLNEVLDDLRVVQKQKFSLQRQIEDTDRVVQELKQKMFSAVELLQKYKKERDEFEVERDGALRVAEELKEKQVDRASSSSMCQSFSEFSLSEIEEATNNFSESLKIGEGGFGGIYRGILRFTQVAIKVLYPDRSQGPVEFWQEVNILSRLRHPNIVNLIGACPEAYALIYEYLPHGNLEDRLSCKNNTPPLSWQTRVHIAAELCSAIIFLHSCRPQGIVHGDLKPSNILLDANFVCKLGDFGICRQLVRNENTENTATQFWRTDCPKGTPVYIDPEFLATGELTSKSDIYSFGIILLRLLTGRPALRIAKEVQFALDKGHLKELLDPTAGDWPFVLAKQLTHLALSCSDVNHRSRPDLASEVWRVLEPMKIACGGVMSLRHRSEERSQIPSYFACPIFQEVMQDPMVAADGYTYELEAIKGWLESGHNTSPMTNLKLVHCNLVPNYALRSAIQEWLQTPQN